jgi:hypothetical protein
MNEHFLPRIKVLAEILQEDSFQTSLIRTKQQRPRQQTELCRQSIKSFFFFSVMKSLLPVAWLGLAWRPQFAEIIGMIASLTQPTFIYETFFFS